MGSLAPFTLKGFYLLTWGNALGSNVWNTIVSRLRDRREDTHPSLFDPGIDPGNEEGLRRTRRNSGMLDRDPGLWMLACTP